MARLPVPLLLCLTVGSVVQWTECQNVPVIFSVAREEDMSEAEAIVGYQHVFVNYGNYFSLLTNLVTLPNASNIMQTISAASLQGARIEYFLHEGQPPDGTDRANIYTTDSNLIGSTTVCRSSIAKSTSHDVISTSTELGSKLASDRELRETTWSGFDAEQLMSPFHALFAGRTAGSTGVPETINFDDVITDSSTGWNPFIGVYTITVGGFYFVSVSLGQNPNEEAYATLYSSFDGTVFGVASQGTLSTGIGMATNSIVLFALPGEEFSVYDEVGSYYSNEYLQTSLTILLIAPAYNSVPIAWGVFTYETFDYSDKTHDLSPFPYTMARVNTQDGNGNGIFDYSTMTITITTPGYYYIHINAQTMEGKDCQMNVVVKSGANNARIEAGLSYNIRAQNGVATIGRALVLELSMNDQLYTELAMGTAVENGPSIANSFSGFLLSPS